MRRHAAARRLYLALALTALAAPQARATAPYEPIPLGALAPSALARPELTLEGTVHHALSAHLVDVSVVDRGLEVRITLRVENIAADPGTGELYHPFFEDPNVAIGRVLGVAFGQGGTRFEAPITALHAEFKPNGVPLLRIEAGGLTALPKRPRRDGWELAPERFEGELREDEETGASTRHACAEMLGVPDLVAGAEVVFGGVGPWFSGVWTAHAVTHHFDAASGFRTRVEATPLHAVPLVSVR